jgi:hypothetical protein
MDPIEVNLRIFAGTKPISLPSVGEVGELANRERGRKPSSEKSLS